MARRIPQRPQRVKRHAGANGREKDNRVFVRLGLLLICGLSLACGFVYAGRQHFTALNYGYQTQEMRRERDRLAEEHHQYLAQREAAANPIHLEQAAKRLGLQPLQAAQIDPLRQQKAETRTVVAPRATSRINAPEISRSKSATGASAARARKPI